MRAKRQRNFIWGDQWLDGGDRPPWVGGQGSDGGLGNPDSFLFWHQALSSVIYVSHLILCNLFAAP